MDGRAKTTFSKTKKIASQSFEHKRLKMRLYRESIAAKRLFKIAATVPAAHAQIQVAAKAATGIVADEVVAVDAAADVAVVVDGVLRVVAEAAASSAADAINSVT